VDKVAAKDGQHWDTQLLCATRASLGTAYLRSSALRRLGTREADGSPAASKVITILGVRHLIQALITSARPSETVIKVGSGVDAAHAASMVILGLLSLRWRGAPRSRMPSSPGRWP
jgi:hypothetical protein